MPRRQWPVLLIIALIAIGGWSVARANQSAMTYRTYLPMLNGCTAEQIDFWRCGSLDSKTLERVMRPEMVRLVNNARKANGCPEATIHPILWDATQEWAEYARDVEFHHSPNTFYKSRGYLHTGREAMTQAESADGAFESLWTSDPHKAILLDCEWSKPESPYYVPGTTYDIGIGAAYVPSDYNQGAIWVVVIGAQFPEPDPTPTP